MKKNIVETLACLSLFVLTGCDQNSSSIKGNVLTDEEAKTQISAMNAEISKDNFVLPTCGMNKMDNKISSSKTQLTSNFDTRFNIKVGSRYFYRSTSVSGVNSNLICLYEKEGTYYYHIENFAVGEKNVGTYGSEEAFKTAFDEYCRIGGCLADSIKNTIYSPYESVSSVYASKESTENNCQTSFEKVNDSSFSFTAMITSEEDGMKMDVIETIVVNNYLLDSITSSLETTKGEQKGSIVSNAYYTWGSVDYIYPQA